MKALTTAGLTKLIQLIKSSFISVDDTVTTTTVTLADVATTGSYNDLTNKPTIPTESTVSGWGFTKNTGTVTSVNNIQPVNGNVTIPDELPSQSGNSGKFLTTDGSDVSWATVDALPTQTGQSGKFLTTNGTDASWTTVSTIPNTDNTTVSLNSSDELQAIGVIDKNTGNAKYDWVGTLSQYTTQAVATTHPDWVCYITDDDTSGAYDAYTKAEVNSLVASSISTLVGSMYPVGSIYIGTTSTCPIASLITGSTWQLVATDRVLQGAGTRGSVGTTVNESLPNITGTFGASFTQGNFFNRGSGAFGSYRENNINTTVPQDSTAQYSNNNMWDFDASRSSSTYQDNAPVQQDAYIVNIWERTA